MPDTWGYSCCLASAIPRIGFGASAYPIIDMGPTLVDAFSVLVLNQSQRSVVEFDQRAAVVVTQPVLQVRDYRVRHEQRPGDFQQSRVLDRLHVSPEMPVAIA